VKKRPKKSCNQVLKKVVTIDVVPETITPLEKEISDVDFERENEVKETTPYAEYEDSILSRHSSNYRASKIIGNMRDSIIEA
jgi:hypothetical protein